MKAKEFDKKFDSGESIVQYLELERTARPGQEQRRVNVDFPAWMISQLDREAKRLGVPRQSLIKIWIAEKLQSTWPYIRSSGCPQRFPKVHFFRVKCINLMEGLKLLLIDRPKSKGMDPALITAFLKALTHLISSEPGIEPAVANQKLNSLGWNEVVIDYHSLQIAIACFEAETKVTKAAPGWYKRSVVQGTLDQLEIKLEHLVIYDRIEG
jgi:hypothetical protein